MYNVKKDSQSKTLTTNILIEYLNNTDTYSLNITK